MATCDKCGAGKLTEHRCPKCGCWDNKEFIDSLPDWKQKKIRKARQGGRVSRKHKG